MTDLAKLSERAFRDLTPLMDHPEWNNVHIFSEPDCEVGFYWIYNGWFLEINYDLYEDNSSIYIATNHYPVLPDDNDYGLDTLFTRDVDAVRSIARARLDWLQSLKDDRTSQSMRRLVDESGTT